MKELYFESGAVIITLILLKQIPRSGGEGKDFRSDQEADGPAGENREGHKGREGNRYPVEEVVPGGCGDRAARKIPVDGRIIEVDRPWTNR